MFNEEVVISNPNKVLSISADHRLVILPVCLCLVWLAGCASAPTAQTDFDPDFDFQAVRSIAIQPVNRSVSSVAVISDIQVGRVAQSLENELTRRGYTVNDGPEHADMLLTWHLVTQERTNVRTYNAMSARYSSCWHCSPSSNDSVRITQYTQGTFIVDLLDPARNQSVWRGVVESRMPDMGDSEVSSEAREQAVQAIFEAFPPN